MARALTSASKGDCITSAKTSGSWRRLGACHGAAMQNIVVAEPYRFVPPHRGGFWPWLFGRLLVRSKLRAFGVEQVQFKGLDRLRASFAAGHGVMLTPNHCRPCDPWILKPEMALMD